jgi:hypothetical protein
VHSGQAPFKTKIKATAAGYFSSSKHLENAFFDDRSSQKAFKPFNVTVRNLLFVGMITKL